MVPAKLTVTPPAIVESIFLFSIVAGGGAGAGAGAGIEVGAGIEA